MKRKLLLSSLKSFHLVTFNSFKLIMKVWNPNVLDLWEISLGNFNDERFEGLILLQSYRLMFTTEMTDLDLDL